LRRELVWIGARAWEGAFKSGHCVECEVKKS
jgi:hypothetical protein